MKKGFGVGAVVVIIAIILIIVGYVYYSQPATVDVSDEPAVTETSMDTSDMTAGVAASETMTDEEVSATTTE